MDIKVADNKENIAKQSNLIEVTNKLVEKAGASKGSDGVKSVPTPE